MTCLEGHEQLNFPVLFDQVDRVTEKFVMYRFLVVIFYLVSVLIDVTRFLGFTVYPDLQFILHIN